MYIYVKLAFKLPHGTVSLLLWTKLPEATASARPNVQSLASASVEIAMEPAQLQEFRVRPPMRSTLSSVEDYRHVLGSHGEVLLSTCCCI